jgi:hypothetical protein
MRPPRRRRRLLVEGLEMRLALSMGPEMPAPVNTVIVGNQVDSDNASAGNGLSVVVWTSYSAPSISEVRAQRFVSGVKVGPEIVVDGSWPHDTGPAVAMARDGDFVVTWTRTLAGGDTNVMARRFLASGAPVAPSFAVASTGHREFEPDVAMGNDGRFVVTYTVIEPNSAVPSITGSQDVLAKLYLNGGNAAPITIGVATTPRNESRSSVAMVPDGLFNVAYQVDSGKGDVRMNRYSTKGVLMAADAVAVTAVPELAPSLALDHAGNAVVAYQELVNGHYAIVARRVSSGDVVSAEVVVRKDGVNHEVPSAALRAAGGAFVVAYNTLVPGINQVEVTEVSALNNVSGPFDAGARRGEPAISIDAANNYLLTYTSDDAGDLNVRGRRGHL